MGRSQTTRSPCRGSESAMPERDSALRAQSTRLPGRRIPPAAGPWESIPDIVPARGSPPSRPPRREHPVLGEQAGTLPARHGAQKVRVRTRTPWSVRTSPSATPRARSSRSSRQPLPAVTFWMQVSCPRDSSQCRF